MDLPSSSIVCIIDWLIRYKWATRRETDMWEESEEGLEGAGEVWTGPPAESSPWWGGGVYELGTQPLDALLPHWVTAESPWIYPAVRLVRDGRAETDREAGGGGRPVESFIECGAMRQKLLWETLCVICKATEATNTLFSLWGWSQTHEKTYENSLMGCYWWFTSFHTLIELKSRKGQAGGNNIWCLFFL